MKDTISVKNARENNLKGIDVEIPRNRLVVLTGLSGSGKSSLAFDTIYAEGQRRLLESMSVFTKKFVTQLKRPDVEFVFGLSPVISIEQKSVSKNPRSTVGTMTDIYDYLRILYATAGVAHCPCCRKEVPVRTAGQIAEHLLSLPEGTAVELQAPVFKVYGEDYAYLFAEIRNKGYRRMRIDGELVDISEDIDLDEGRPYTLAAVIDRFILRKEIHKNLLVSIEHGLRVGEGFLRCHILTPEKIRHNLAPFTKGFACPEHQVVMGELEPYYFAFNEADSGCVTCSGLGTYLKVHLDLLVSDRTRSIRGGAFIPEAFKYDKNSWSGRQRIEVPTRRRKPNGRALLIRGARENNLKNIDVEIPLGLFLCITGASGSGKSTLVNEILYKKLYATFHDSRVLSGKHDAIEGVGHIRDVINIDQSPIGRTPTSNPATYIGVYDEVRRRFANTPEAQARGYTASRFSFNMKGGRCEECGGQGMVTTRLQFMPDVESPCQTCKGARYNQETLEITYRGKNIAQILDMPIEEAAAFFQDSPLVAHKLSVLNDLGMGYLKLGQSSTTISGGEAQRVKLAYELSKVKRGGRNLYILDEPTTGLHLADIQRLLDCLNRLVDAGNSVLVIEHHLDVIKTADYVIDLGPEGGNSGGEIIARGTPEEIAQNPRSYTGQFLKKILNGSAEVCLSGAQKKPARKSPSEPKGIAPPSPSRKRSRLTLRPLLTG